jgi:hypothetical protein
VIARHDAKSHKVLIDLVVVAAWRDLTAMTPGGALRHPVSARHGARSHKVLIVLAAIAAWRDLTAPMPSGRQDAR